MILLLKQAKLKCYILLLTAILALPCLLIATSKSKTQPVTQHQFIQFMQPKIKKVNQGILRQRQHIMQLSANLKNNKSLTLAQEKTLQSLAFSYHIKTCSALPLNTGICFKDLLNRMNTLPAALVLAQAINESSWGQSRFAKQGHNYFGIWCYTKGCGMIPRGRPKGQDYEVRRFVNAEASIAAYFKIINTHQTYQFLRSIRAKQAANGKNATAYQLAAGLEGYSTRRKAYIASIRRIIKLHHLE